ncbi:hypothetical protein BKI52_21290 [marine bacterium AO1-C]|nr:hypothetical protein BKI52_21290 [marine bacterium AO1-C]
MKQVKLYLNYAGHCLAKESEAIQGGRKQKIKFHALWGLIEHPEKGWILYDTGYTPRFYEATSSYPSKIYAQLVKTTIEEHNTVKAQLAAQGISHLDIRHIIITHFHSDHVGGLRDFPNAQFYASRKALDYTLSLSSMFAFSKGVLKELLPDDLAERTTLIDEICSKVIHPILGEMYDLFEDGSLYLVPLPGHAAGQIGVLLETPKRPYFLIADACWLKKSYEEMVLPNPIVKLFFHSWSDFKASLHKIHRYHQAHPEACIVPTHCAETTDPLVQTKLDMDVL